MSELVRLKTGNYIYFIAQANLHFGELIISIIVVSKIDENCCKQTLASLPWFWAMQVVSIFYSYIETTTANCICP